MRFNPSQGLGCFSTCPLETCCLRVLREFQSLSGIRLLFHLTLAGRLGMGLKWFQSLSGIRLLFHSVNAPWGAGGNSLVSIPLRD